MLRASGYAEDGRERGQHDRTARAARSHLEDRLIATVAGRDIVVDLDRPG